MPEDEKTWEELTNDELIRELFPQDVVESAKELAHEKDDPDDLEEPLEE